jgi:hypothetical protein
MDNVHINNSDEVIEAANKLSSEGRIDELKELLSSVNDEIDRLPLDERSSDNQLSLLKSKYEIESLIKRNVVVEIESVKDKTKKEESTEGIDLEKVLSNKDNFFIICVVVSVISAIGFFKFGWNFLFAFVPFLFFKNRKKK